MRVVLERAAEDGDLFEPALDWKVWRLVPAPKVLVYLQRPGSPSRRPGFDLLQALQLPGQAMSPSVSVARSSSPAASTPNRFASTAPSD